MAAVKNGLKSVIGINGAAAADACAVCDENISQR
jgi:hypothetical protein